MRYHIVALLVLAAAVSTLTAGCSAQKTTTAPPITFITPSAVSSADLEKRLADIKLVISEPDPDGVELVSVGLAAAELAQMMVVFKGPPALIANWWQGSVYVIDESRNLVYQDIPVAPLIGPLIGKPKEAGQTGYAMLANFDGGIKSGSVVTVVLGKYKREHIKVE